MFTGIIQELGTVAQVRRSKGLVRLTIAAPKTSAHVQPLDSIAVNGVCLTAVSVRGEAMTFEVIEETQRLTTLGRLRAGDRINLEPSLLVSDLLNGHLMFGHVDGIGTILARRQRSAELVLELRVAPSLGTWLVPKGPIALDGVSLTVGQVRRGATFTVHLIPETLRQTALGARRVEDHVNVEVDYFAKLIRQCIKRMRTS